MVNKVLLSTTLAAPKKPNELHEDAQWLAGEGAGSWFYIHQHSNEDWIIDRYSPNGSLECSSEFTMQGSSSFEINLPFKFTHLSHCQRVSIVQNGCTYIFEKKGTL